MATAKAAPSATSATMVRTRATSALPSLASSASKNHLFHRLMPTVTARLAKTSTRALAVQNQAVARCGPFQKPSAL